MKTLIQLVIITLMAWPLPLVAEGPAQAPPSSRVGPLDRAFYQMDSAYPGTRHFDGSLSILSGTLATVGGFILGLDTHSPADEQIMGYTAVLLGSLQLIDGIPRFFGRSSAELLVPHYYPMPVATKEQKEAKIRYGEGTLQRLAGKASSARKLRALCDIALSSTYLYLFLKGDKQIDASGNESGKHIYRYLIIPSAFLSLTAIYRFFMVSPEESILESYQTKPDTLSASLHHPEFFAFAIPGVAGLGIKVDW